MTTQSFIKKFNIIVPFLCLSLILCSCQTTEYTQETKVYDDGEDVLKQFQLKDEQNVNKIREYDVGQQTEYNGDTAFWSRQSTDEDDENRYYRSSDDRPRKTEEIQKQYKDTETREKKKEVTHWKYYDEDEKDFGDAYYYLEKTKDGRTNYIYAYSLIKGKQKTYDKAVGSYGRVITVPMGYEVPEDMKDWANENGILIMHMDDSEWGWEFVEDGYDNPYGKLADFNSEDTQKYVQNQVDELRREGFKDLGPSIYNNEDYLSNLERKIEDNSFESVTNKDRADYVILNLIEQNKTEDIRSLAKSKEELEEINYIDGTTGELNSSDFEKLILFAHVGYESELVVLRLNDINKIFARKDAIKTITDIYKIKFDIIKKASTTKDLQLAREYHVSCPSTRETAIQKYLSDKRKEFDKAYMDRKSELSKVK